MTTAAQKLAQAQASWGGLLAPIGIFFPGTNTAAAKVTAKIPVVGTILAGLQNYTGVTTTTTKKKATKAKNKKKR
jgi:hypothetical protein